MPNPNLVADPFNIENWGATTNIYNSINEVDSRNGIRNSIMVGTVPGSPGTLPNNWINNLLSGLSMTINSIGYEGNLPYIEIRFFGTSTGSTIRISPEQTFSVPEMSARMGETWTVSAYAKLVAGTLAGVGVFFTQLIFRDSGNSVLTQTLTPPGITINGSIQRVQNTFQATDPATRYTNMDLRFNITPSAVIDFTVRFYAPQAEPKEYATGFMPTSGVGAVRTPVAAPGGGFMDRIIEDTTNGQHAAAVTGLVPSGSTVSGYVYVKPAGRTKFRIGSNAVSGVVFDLVAGTVGANSASVASSGRIRNVGNGIYLVELYKFTAGGAQGIFFSLLDNTGADTYAGDGTSGVYLWGAGFYLGDSVQHPYGGTGSAGFTGGWLLAERGHVAPPPPPKPRVRKPSAAELAAKERERQIAARQKELSSAEAARIARAQKLWGNDSPEPDTIRLPNAMPRDRGPKIVKLPKRR